MDASEVFDSEVCNTWEVPAVPEDDDHAGSVAQLVLELTPSALVRDNDLDAVSMGRAKRRTKLLQALRRPCLAPGQVVGPLETRPMR